MTLILGIGAAIAVVLAVLVIGGLLVGSMIRKAKKGKPAAPVAAVAEATASSPFAKAESEFQELMSIGGAVYHQRFIDDYKAKKVAEFEALSSQK